MARSRRLDPRHLTKCGFRRGRIGDQRRPPKRTYQRTYPGRTGSAAEIHFPYMLTFTGSYGWREANFDSFFQKSIIKKRQQYQTMPPLPSALSWRSLRLVLLSWWWPTSLLLFHPSSSRWLSKVVSLQHRDHHRAAARAVAIVLLLPIVVKTTTDATNVQDDSIGSLDFGPCRITALLPFR
jgi:hypothetical protein